MNETANIASGHEGSLRLFTWSFREALVCRDEIVVVRISIGKPKWIAPADAAAMPFVSELAPYGAFHIEDDAEFERVYRERLETKGVELIEQRVRAVGAEYPGLPIVLCCFERDPAACHRSSFARWWFERTGEEVPEYRRRSSVQPA